jgi:hypothetical protein
MSNKTRSVLKGIAVVLVLLAVLMHIGTISIPALRLSLLDCGDLFRRCVDHFKVAALLFPPSAEWIHCS